MLQCDHVSFGYLGDAIFQDVTFTLSPGERLGLVAPNGAGKTTLLRLLAGEQAPDQGSVIRGPSTTVAFLRQSHEIPSEGTVLEALLAGYADVISVRNELQAAMERATTGDESALQHLAEVQTRYEVLSGHSLEHKVQTLAAYAGFSAVDMERRVSSLSGGERGRLALAEILALDPSVLLLDEPTNHLDLETTVKLEEFLKGFGGIVVIVSHDRAFLEATCNRIGELGSKKFRLYHGTYSQYLVQREAELVREQATASQQQAFVEKTEDFIRRNIAGQKTKQAQSRRKMLDKLERVDRPEDVWADAKRMAFRFAPARRSGDIVIEATSLRSERGGRTLYKDLDLLIRRGERLAIVGPNGAGKSTLLKVMAGAREPNDTGNVRIGANVDQGYFDQHLESLDPESSPVEQVRQVRPDFVVDAAREYLARFRIVGDDPFRTIRSFSGGERTRVALAKLLLVSRNLLFLDEPTNHLDIPATEILEEALRAFEGSVVFVSHDRYFLQQVATRVLHLENGEAVLYDGTYEDFVVYRGRAKTGVVESNGKPLPKSAARDSYDKAKAKQREAERRVKRLAQLEDEIAVTEREIARLKGELLNASDDWEALAKKAERERSLQRRVDRMMEEWSTLSEEAQ